MNFLILSCNTGEGHNSAAKALKEYFENNGSTCEIMDSLSFWSKESSKIISKGHVFVYRNLPKLFGATYRFEENHPPKEGNESLIYDIVTNGHSRLGKYLEDRQYDAVICVHVFSAMMMAKLRKSGKADIPCYFVATDYTCSPGVGETECDLYFIPHKDLYEEFSDCGIKRDKLVASGIPIKQGFYERIEKSEAKKLLGIDEKERVVLLSCGSMGCGPIKELSEKLPQSLPEDVRVIIICGNNKRLYTHIYKKELPNNLTVLGYTTKMSLYMDAADLIMTKPGGLSSTESAVKHKPIVFIDAVPGCETRNLEFFSSHGFAVFGKDTKELISIVKNCMMYSSDLEAVSKSIAENFAQNSAKVIYEAVTRK